MGLGWGLAGLARHDEAIEALRQAATLAPGDPVPQGYLGWALGLAGKREEANAILEDLERQRMRCPARRRHGDSSSRSPLALAYPDP